MQGRGSTSVSTRLNSTPKKFENPTTSIPCMPHRLSPPATSIHLEWHRAQLCCRTNHRPHSSITHHTGHLPHHIHPAGATQRGFPSSTCIQAPHLWLLKAATISLYDAHLLLPGHSLGVHWLQGLLPPLLSHHLLRSLCRGAAPDRVTTKTALVDLQPNNPGPDADADADADTYPNHG